MDFGLKTDKGLGPSLSKTTEDKSSTCTGITKTVSVVGLTLLGCFGLGFTLINKSSFSISEFMVAAKKIHR